MATEQDTVSSPTTKGAGHKRRSSTHETPGKIKRQKKMRGLAVVSQHKGPQWDKERDTGLWLTSMLLMIWQLALTVEDRLVHYFGYGAKLPAKARIPRTKEYVSVGVAWITAGRCYLGNTVTDANRQHDGTDAPDPYKNPVCIASACNMGFWPFPPE